MMTTIVGVPVAYHCGSSGTSFTVEDESGNKTTYGLPLSNAAYVAPYTPDASFLESVTGTMVVIAAYGGARMISFDINAGNNPLVSLRPPDDTAAVTMPRAYNIAELGI